MWPWEHAIVGYLVYSLVCHAAYRDSPGGIDAFAAVFASVLPDLIDKPLAWQYGVFDSGYALGHSIFAAVPLSIAVALAARSVDRRRAGLAFGLGYLLHLPADVVDAVVREDAFLPHLALWPVVRIPDSGTRQGFLDQFALYFTRYQSELLAGDLPTYVWVQLGLAALTFLLWLADGAPVLREVLCGCRRFALAILGSDGQFDESTGRR